MDNNDTRTETPEEARRLDHLSRAAWLGHPKHFVIDNATDFEGKMNKLVAIASRLVGLPTTSKSVTIKYLLKGEPDLATFPEEVQYSVFEVEKVGRLASRKRYVLIKFDQVCVFSNDCRYHRYIYMTWIKEMIQTILKNTVSLEKGRKYLPKLESTSDLLISLQQFISHMTASKLK